MIFHSVTWTPRWRAPFRQAKNALASALRTHLGDDGVDGPHSVNRRSCGRYLSSGTLPLPNRALPGGAETCTSNRLRDHQDGELGRAALGINDPWSKAMHNGGHYQRNEGRHTHRQINITGVSMLMPVRNRTKIRACFSLTLFISLSLSFCVFTEGSGSYHHFRPRPFCRAPVDGPGFPPTDANGPTHCVVRALTPTWRSHRMCVIAKETGLSPLAATCGRTWVFLWRLHIKAHGFLFVISEKITI